MQRGVTQEGEPADQESGLKFLLSRIDYERSSVIPYHLREFHLERMRNLLARLGNPHDRLKVVHVAGTKGKGSTAAMIASVLTMSGRRTGLYSSPHLDRVEERIAIDGAPCPPARLAELIEKVRPAVEMLDRAAHDGEAGPTYFEITTAMAFLQFAEMQVETAVLEVGLGGRLDSTNVCQPVVSVITSISFDHMKQLGTTLAAIAAEKAGIIKPGVPVVSGVVDVEPRAVIERVSREQGSLLTQLGTDFDFAYRPPRSDAMTVAGGLDFRQDSPAINRRYDDLQLAMPGRHQAANAAVAVATLLELERQGWGLCESSIRRGLAQVRLPARVELVRRRPTVIIDAAHNTASVRSLLATLDESFPGRRRILIFATTRDKDIRGMLELLLPAFDEVIMTRYLSNPRSLQPEEIQQAAAGLLSAHCRHCDNPAAAWRMAHQLAAEKDLICVTGSFFLAAEIRAEAGRKA